jgi:release factor glutamine methyltransferase
VNHPLWKDLIESAAAQLFAEGISDAEINAELLASHALNVWKRSELRPFLNTAVDSVAQANFQALIDRRLLHEPLQYITGETEFFGLRLWTTPAALIPRPETEVLVEQALIEAAKLLENSDRITVLDIGTGTGAIAIALASQNASIDTVGIDVSADAIELAMRNGARHSLPNVRFECIDIFDDAALTQFDHSVDLLVSNPPYISESEFGLLEDEIKHFEPRVALTDESDGLVFYDRIALLAPRLLKAGGRVIVEMSFDASESVIRAFANSGIEAIRIDADLAGIERVFVGRLTIDLERSGV